MAEPYAWAIEYGDGHVAFFIRNEKHDKAYVEMQAVRLHGVIVPLYRERRKQ